MFKIPFQKHIIAVMLIISRAEFSQAFIQEEMVCSRFPFKAAQIIENKNIKTHTKLIISLHLFFKIISLNLSVSNVLKSIIHIM